MRARLLALLGCAVTLAGVPTTLAPAWDRKKRDDRFNERVTKIGRPPIAGEAFGGPAAGRRITVRSRVVMNHEGGGEEHIKAMSGPEGLCNLPERLAAAIRFGSSACGAVRQSYTIPLFDRSVFPPRAIPSTVIQPAYGRLGHRADDIKSMSDVEAVVDRLAEARENDNPLLDPVPARFDVTAELMENVIVSRRGRHSLVNYLTSISAAVPQEDVLDPRDRPASLIEVPDSSRAGRVVFRRGDQVRVYDLTDAAEVTMQLYYDPESFAILARRDVLDSTTLPELQSYIESRPPGAAYLYSRVVGPVKTVRKPWLVAYRVPCRKLADAAPNDNFCVELGRPGGRSISFHLKRG